MLERTEKFLSSISLCHSLKNEVYLDIVRPVIKAIPTDKNNLLELVKENIKKIKARNLIVKLNFVLLKNKNTDKKRY